MKQLFIILSVIFMASCNTTQKVTSAVDSFLKSHNYQQNAVYDPTTQTTTVTASIEGLYNTTELQKLCEKADVTFRIVKGRVEISATCAGAEAQLKEIFSKLFKNISFKQ